MGIYDYSKQEKVQPQAPNEATDTDKFLKARRTVLEGLRVAQETLSDAVGNGYETFDKKRYLKLATGLNWLGLAIEKLKRIENETQNSNN